MMNQATLTAFEKLAPSFSDPEHPHLLQKIDGKWECTCQGFEQWRHCGHASKEIQREAFETNDICALIMDLKSHARYRTFQNVMDHFSGSSDEMFLYLQAVALGIAYERNVCADDLHYACKERILKSPRIIGSALGDLKRKGYLEIVGEKKSERPICHFRPIKIFHITDKGRKFLNDGGIL